MADSLKKSSRRKRPLNWSFDLKMLVLYYATKRQMKDTLSKATSVAEKGWFSALYCLLDELSAVNCISFLEAFDQFAGKLPSIACKPDKSRPPQKDCVGEWSMASSWWAVEDEFQRAGNEKVHRKAFQSKWLPPLSLCVHFRKDFALKSGLYPLICCECRIIYKAQKHR